MLYSRANEGSLLRDPIEGELPRPRSLANGTEPCLANPHKHFHGRVSGPRANPYRTGHGRPLESPDNNSTRNPQFTTRLMGVAETSPFVPRRDGEGAYKLVGEPAPRTGPGSGARRTATPSGVHRTQTMPDTCTWLRRGRLKYHQCRLKLTPRTPADPVKKPCRSTHAPARLRGLDPRVH
jgi:hypothetical protein